MYFVYILQSKSSGRFYIGSTDHLIRRFNEHCSGENISTRYRGPWWVPYYEIFDTRADALTREKQFKSWKSARAIQNLIANARY